MIVAEPSTGAQNSSASSATPVQKHVLNHQLVMMHYIRDLTGKRMVLPTHVTTDLQRADGFTKALDKSKFSVWVTFVIT